MSFAQDALAYVPSVAIGVLLGGWMTGRQAAADRKHRSSEAAAERADRATETLRLEKKAAYHQYLSTLMVVDVYWETEDRNEQNQLRERLATAVADLHMNAPYEGPVAKALSGYLEDLGKAQPPDLVKVIKKWYPQFQMAMREEIGL